MKQQNVSGNGITAIMLSVLLLCLGGSLMAEEPSVEIYDAARQGFELYKSGNFNLEFCSTEEWETITLGKGFQIYTVKPDRLLGTEKNENTVPFDLQVTPTNQWCFFVNVNDQPIAMVYVELQNGQWEAVGIGNAVLAREIAEMNRTWPQSAGFTSRFIRIFEAKSDFLQINHNDDKQGFVPFSSARRALMMEGGQFDHNTLLFESDFVEPLKRIVRKNFSLNAGEEK